MILGGTSLREMAILSPHQSRNRRTAIWPLVVMQPMPPLIDKNGPVTRATGQAWSIAKTILLVIVLWALFIRLFGMLLALMLWALGLPTEY